MATRSAEPAPRPAAARHRARGQPDVTVEQPSMVKDIERLRKRSEVNLDSDKGQRVVAPYR